MSDISEHVEMWKRIHEKFSNVDNWIGAAGSLILILVCVYVLIVVLLIHKRKEWFLIVTTILFGLYGALGLPFYILELDDTTKYNNRDLPLLISSIFCAALAHWIFSVQYLKTSLILPITLREAKLEWLHDMKDNNCLNPMDYKRLNDELANYKHQTQEEAGAHNAMTNTFKQFDEVILSLKLRVQR